MVLNMSTGTTPSGDDNPVALGDAMPASAGVASPPVPPLPASEVGSVSIADVGVNTNTATLGVASPLSAPKMTHSSSDGTAPAPPASVASTQPHAVGASAIGVGEDVTGGHPASASAGQPQDRSVSQYGRTALPVSEPATGAQNGSGQSSVSTSSVSEPAALPVSRTTAAVSGAVTFLQAATAEAAPVAEARVLMESVVDPNRSFSSTLVFKDSADRQANLGKVAEHLSKDKDKNGVIRLIPGPPRSKIVHVFFKDEPSKKAFDTSYVSVQQDDGGKLSVLATVQRQQAGETRLTGFVLGVFTRVHVAVINKQLEESFGPHAPQVTGFELVKSTRPEDLKNPLTAFTPLVTLVVRNLPQRTSRLVVVVPAFGPLSFESAYYVQRRKRNAKDVAMLAKMVVASRAAVAKVPALGKDNKLAFVQANQPAPAIAGHSAVSAPVPPPLPPTPVSVRGVVPGVSPRGRSRTRRPAAGVVLSGGASAAGSNAISNSRGGRSLSAAPRTNPAENLVSPAFLRAALPQLGGQRHSGGVSAGAGTPPSAAMPSAGVAGLDPVRIESSSIDGSSSRVGGDAHPSTTAVQQILPVSQTPTPLAPAESRSRSDGGLTSSVQTGTGNNGEASSETGEGTGAAAVSDSQSPESTSGDSAVRKSNRSRNAPERFSPPQSGGERGPTKDPPRL